MKIGLLFGSVSGQGKAPSAAPLLARALDGRESAVCPGAFGSGSPGPWAELHVPPVSSYIEGLRSSALALAGWGAEIFVCVGGDGLAAYLADALIERGLSPKILGVAAGTANVGPLLRARAADLESLDFDALAWEPVDALEAMEDGIHLAYAFNDIVLGDSFLGSLGSKAASLSAEALVLSQKKLPVKPGKRIAGIDFEVRKNGHLLSGAKPGEIAQIVASPLRKDEFLGRAVAGALCEAPFLEGAGALCLFDFIVVAAEAPEKGLSEFASCAQILFTTGDIVELSGLGPDAHIIVDGNPYLRRGERLGFAMKRHAAFAARLPSRGREAHHD